MQNTCRCSFIVREVSLAILDIAENSIDAKATLIRIRVTKSDEGISFEVADDGSGMSDKTLRKATAKGFSTKGGAGLGLALLEEETALAGGELKIVSQEGKGTTVFATYKDVGVNIGNLGATFVALVDEGYDTVLETDNCGIKKSYDTRELKSSSSVAELQSGGVLRLIREDINKNN